MARVTLAVVILLLGGEARAGLIYTSSPVESWNYAYEANAGHGYSSDYYPTTTAEFQAAAFQGFVTYSQINNDGSAYFGPVYDDPGDTFHIFTTYVTSVTAQTVDLTIAGDDGHSLFINDQFVAGGGFGATSTYDLSLQAGVAAKVELAGYNGPGGWVFGITAPESYGGITINADPPVSSAPEPSTLSLLGIGAVGLIGYGWWRRKRPVPA